ncbi:hypothetical protein WJX72_005477 [[Myrmecia] bisecta]|uniref:Essential protein Yae1 N-terminal domain-containing protein n=1 Tax=[Myrmecia] bisecta TaxID=41462 RepID=A0AAW1QQR6_9CHLO
MAGREAAGTAAGGAVQSSDIFDSSLQLEEQHIKEGYAEGVRDGKLAGLREGQELGIQKGFEIAQEIGFYAGCIQVWRKLRMHDPEAFPARVEKGIDSIAELVAAYPLENPKDERMQDMMLELRGKFKAVVAMLGVHEEYLPRERAAEPAYSF